MLLVAEKNCLINYGVKKFLRNSWYYFIVFVILCSNQPFWEWTN